MASSKASNKMPLCEHRRNSTGRLIRSQTSQASFSRRDMEGIPDDDGEAGNGFGVLRDEGGATAMMDPACKGNTSNANVDGYGNSRLHPVSGLFGISRYLMTRGHYGKVQAVDGSADLEFILTAGEDYTMRVWEYNEEFDAYSLAYMLKCTPPDGRPVKCEPGFLELMLPKSLAQSIFKSDTVDDERMGITAVNHVDSKNEAYYEGQRVILEADADYVKQELAFVDLPYEDFMEYLLGETWEIHKPNAHGNPDLIALVPPKGVDIPVTMPDGVAEHGVIFPTSCVQREKEPETRNGPFLCGTAHGDLNVLCWNSEPHEAVRSFPRLHKEAINGISTCPMGGHNLAFLIVTASDDGECALLRLECEEAERAELQEDSALAAPNMRHFFTRELTAHQQLEDEKKKTPTLILKLKSIAEVKDETGSEIRLKLDGAPVLSVTHCTYHVEKNKITIATLTVDGCYCWNSHGDLLMRLILDSDLLFYNVVEEKEETVEPHIQIYSELCGVQKEDVTLLFIVCQDKTGETYTAVWGVEDGMVELPEFRTLTGKAQEKAWNEFLEKYKEKKICPDKITAYRKNGIQLAVDIDGFSPQYAAQVEDGTRVKLWTLQVSAPQRFARDPPSPINVLVMPGCEQIALELKHDSQVRDVRFVVDDDSTASSGGAGGPAVLVGCDDGSCVLWDVEGRDKGQKYAQLRSLTPLEIIIPVVVLIVTTIQLMSFAFTPQIPWEDRVRRPARIIYRIGIFDYDFNFNVARRTIILIKIRVVLGLMAFYTFSGMVGFPIGLQWLIFKIMESESFTSGKPLAKLAVAAVRGFSTVLKIWIQLMSTIFVVPMMTICSQFLNCKPGFYPGSHLLYTEEMTCLEWGGEHLTDTCVLFLLMPLYFFVLIPHAVVKGDCDYVPPATLYDWKFWKADCMWRRACTRAVTTLNLGVLHMHPKRAYITTIVELSAKIILPFISNAALPITQMVLTTLVMLGVFVQTYRAPLYIEEKMKVLTQHLKLLTVLAMAAGTLTCIVGDTSYASLLFISVATLVVVVHLACRMSTLELRRKHWKGFSDLDAKVENAKGNLKY